MFSSSDTVRVLLLIVIGILVFGMGRECYHLLLGTEAPSIQKKVATVTLFKKTYPDLPFNTPISTRVGVFHIPLHDVKGESPVLYGDAGSGRLPGIYSVTIQIEEERR